MTSSSSINNTHNSSPAEPQIDILRENNSNSKIMEDLSRQMQGFYHEHVSHVINRETLERHKIPVAIVLVSLLLTGNLGLLYTGLLYPLYWLILRIIAMALGTALGLGFATHVYDQLEDWTMRTRRQQQHQHDHHRRSTRREETAALLHERVVGTGSSTSGSASASASSHPGNFSMGKQYTKVAPTSHAHHQANKLWDPSSYAALMASAGYEVDPNWKRGQVVKDPLPPHYPFCDIQTEQQYAIQVMIQEFPMLPTPIHTQMGRFMEFIMRDYVSTWYSMIDYSDGIQYPWCVQKAKDKVACLERGDVWVEPPPQPPPPPHLYPRRMVLTTASTRTLPLLEQLYRSIAVVFGNLAHRVQDVNVFQLVLLKWVKVIAHTFKIYRQLRKSLLDKQSVHKLKLFEEARSGVVGSAGRAIMRRAVNTVKSTGNSTTAAGTGSITTGTTTIAMEHSSASLEDSTSTSGALDTSTNMPSSIQMMEEEKLPSHGYQPVSEMAVTREFLVTGKLHPACTFGLDIPSLLFADPHGNDCGTGIPGEDPSSITKKRDEDQVLEQRLFHTNLLKECELDYNRVVASRMIKLLVPRADYGSPIVAALLTEIMAGSVLTPVMSIFSPDYLNDWIAKGMDKSGDGSAEGGSESDGQSVSNEGESNTAATAKAKKATTNKPQSQPQPVMRTWTEESEHQLEDEASGQPVDLPSVSTRIRSFSEEEGEMVLEDGLDEEGRQELGELMDLSDNPGDMDMDLSTYHREAAEDMLGTTAGSGGATTTTASTTTGGPASSVTGSSHGDISGDDDYDEDDDILLEGSASAGGVYPMISLLHAALMNLQRHVDMEEARRRGSGNSSSVTVNWDNKDCQAAVLRLVLTVEALLFHGRRRDPIRIPISKIGSSIVSEASTLDGGRDTESELKTEPEDKALQPTVEDEFNATSMMQILMDLTSDIEAFETMHVKPQDEASDADDGNDDESQDGDEGHNNVYVPSVSDISTLRTLIAAWLHTGQIYRTISTLVKARTTVLKPFYHSYAFLRKPNSATALTEQLKVLDGIDVMVDTVSILSDSRIDLDQEIKQLLEGSSPRQVIAGSVTHKEGPQSGEVPAASFKLGFKGLLDKSKKALNEQRKVVAGNVGSIVKKNPLNRSTTGEPSVSSSITPASTPAIPAPTTPRKETSAPASYHQSTVNSTSPVTMAQMQQQFVVSGGTPRYLDYHRNEAFASSLRSERERRMQSWISSIQNDTELVQVVCRTKGSTPEDVAYHRELHHVARIFYAGTNLVGIRDAARSNSTKQRNRLNSAGSTQSVTSTMSDQSASESQGQSPEVSLLTVEMACSRRKIEVPDDDSSFLLRAQPRPLNAIGVHRDTRNADQSYRCFQGSYEEPAILPGSNNYKGGRYIRRCLIKYYPSDRTASVAVQNDGRKLDQRKGKSIVPDTIKVKHQSAVPFISPDFLKARHLCEKWIPSGSTSRSQPGMLSSTVMEQSDFTAAPRTGKALDFVYRMSLFERPMISLGGKRFTIHDSSTQGAHRADASALEMSDPALSAALLVIGRDYNDLGATDSQGDASSVHTSQTNSTLRNKVELGPDGYPIIWMKYSRKQDDSSTSTEIKPYRVSFVRAALLVTSTRQEAQLQCLIKCVKAGSAKSATKARTDAQLRPTLRLLEFARDRSREKQSILLRDLKLGINHIDREQLRRNALLSPRYPTAIRDIQISIEKAMPARDASVKIAGNPQSTVYKIRCVATVDLVDEELSSESAEAFLTPDSRLGVTYKETWVIYRPFRDFQALHKQLKSQVASTETSGTAGSRLVGAATAAFTSGGALLATTQASRNRERKALIPSLGQAQKAGALGVTQRTIMKRMEILDGYLRHLLSPGHHLSRSSELLMFIGAYFPLAPEVRIGKTPIMTVTDPLGRTEMAREVLKFAPSPKPIPTERSTSSGTTSSQQETAKPSSSKRDLKGSSPRNKSKVSAKAESPGVSTLIEDTELKASKTEKIKMNPAIEAKIDKVPLSKVRSRIFELLGYQFGFENASFLRSRMLSALKTASFAVTTPGEFKKKLYKAHVEHVSPDAIAGWINFGLEILWPDGVFFESKPPLTPEEQKAAAEKSRGLLHAGFPDQLRTVLGQELTHDGLDVLHEMLQNRMVVKSMFYMLFDLLWQDVFPEIKDVLACGESLDINFDDNEN